MGKYVIRRLLLMVPTLLGVVTLVFFVMRIVPGDVARNIAGTDATPEQVQQVKERLGLDRPVAVQYVDYVANLVQGDLGTSAYTPYSVVYELRLRIPRTMALALMALSLASVLGITMGVAAAAKRGSPLDWACQTFAAGSLALPNFVLALALIFIFSERLRWLPSTAEMSPRHLILPVLALGVRESAVIMRMTRATVLDTLHGDYIRTARAKGLSEVRVLTHHALRNALLPVVTVIGLQAGFALSGTVIIETIFNFPGVGRLVVASLNQRDYPMVQGGVLVIGASFLLVNLLVDLTYAWIDPRIRYGSR